MSNDLHNNMKYVPCIEPVALTDATDHVGRTIDRAGYESLEFVIQTGTLAAAAGTWTLTIYEDDDPAMGTEAAVADADLLGTEAGASFTQAKDDKSFKIGYIGNKRYVRPKLVVATSDDASPLAVLAVLGNPKAVTSDLETQEVAAP